MTSRTWVYDRLTTGNVALQTLIGMRVYANTALNEAPTVKPFLITRALAHLPVLSGDDTNQVFQDSFQVFAHDVPGDYMRIDTILGLLRDQFDGVVDQANGIVRCQWVEDSEDFRDDDMGTVLKYCRIQITVRAT